MLINWYTWLLIAAIAVAAVGIKSLNLPRVTLAASTFFGIAAKTILAAFLISVLTLSLSVFKVHDLTIDLVPGNSILTSYSTPEVGATIGVSPFGVSPFVEVLSKIHSFLFPSRSASLISQAIDYLSEAKVFHNIPGDMKVDVPEIIQANVSKELTEALSREFDETGNSKVNSKKIQYDPTSIVLMLRANPDNFKVFPSESVKQVVVPQQPARWRWEVTPLREGKHLLELRAFVELNIPRRGTTPYPLYIDIFSNKISVTSDVYSLLQKSFRRNWKDSLVVLIFLWVVFYFTKNMPETPKYDMRGSHFGNFADTVQEGGKQQTIQHIYASDQRQNLAEAAVEIQQLLDRLATTNFASDEERSEAIYKEIQKNPALKTRLINALKSGGLEALKAVFNHPLFSISVETVKGWLEAE